MCSITFKHKENKEASCIIWQTLIRDSTVLIMGIERLHQEPIDPKPINPENKPAKEQPKSDIPVPESLPLATPEEKSSPLPDIEILNRPKGKETERPIFNVPGLRDKDRVSAEEARRYIEQDRQELKTVAGTIKATLHQEITETAAQKILYDRMNNLRLEAIAALQEHEKITDRIEELTRERDYVPVDPASWRFKLAKLLIENYEAGLTWVKDQPYEKNPKKVGRRFPDKVKELDEKIKHLREESRHMSSFVSGGKEYFVHESTPYRLNHYPAQDIILLYADEQGTNRTLRLNHIQMNLAQHGIYYKGTPTDNTFRSQNTEWDQAAYPTSPLHFYEEHVQGWVNENPSTVEELLTEAKSKK